jgi:phosphoadenosine phosphosulfate reductase
MVLWKDGAFAEDPWRILEDGAPLPEGAAVIVSLARWRAEQAALRQRPGRLGLLIPPGENWSDMLPDLHRFEVIAVTIPKYADGRAFSIARLLRQRDGFTGEIRAVGDYIVDQIPLMRRVGIDAFFLTDPIVIRALEKGDWPEVKNYLQPVDDQREVPAGTRPWARRPGAGPKGGSS